MRILILLISFYHSPLFALEAQDVVQSSLKHFPRVIEAVQELELQKNKAKEAMGEFDGKIKGEIDARTRGFYDGDAYKVSIEKPIPFLNSRVYGGQRQGFGNFPTYEGKYETLSDGENFVGVSMSLLRNSLIDSNRYNLRYQRQNQKQAEINIDLVKLNVQTMALKAYWSWFVKGHELKVYQNILQLAESRITNIRKRIKAGDLAKIYGTENDQYIVKRKAQVSEKFLEFQEASFYLSLFNRTDDGKPVLPKITQLPNLKEQSLSSINDLEAIIANAQSLNLDLKVLASREKQAELDIQMGTNDLLPKVDVNYEWSQDRGIGPTSLAPEENRIMLSLEVPFQYRKGMGKRRAGKAKLDQIRTKQQWTMEKLRAEIQSLVTKINSYIEIYQLTLKQVNLSDQLVKAEQKKFARGASDLILVNIREETLAEVQIKNLMSLLSYHYLIADLRNMQVQFE